MPLSAPVRERAKLGRLLMPNQRSYVYGIPDGIEIDQVDGYEVTRRRVFYSDMLAITLHRHRGIASIVILSSMLAVFLLLLAVANAYAHSPALLATLALPALPTGAVLLLKILRREDRVTVFGRRSKAVMRWHVRSARAREVFDLLVERVRAQQDGGPEPPGLASAQPACAFGAPPADASTPPATGSGRPDAPPPAAPPAGAARRVI